MLSLNDIQHIKRDSGVYSLLKDDEIVYIGRSRNVYCRILEHIIENKKQFDRVNCIYHEDETQMDIMEVFLIDKLSPKYNKLKVDRNAFLKVIPYICRKHIPDDIDALSDRLISLLSKKETKQDIIECGFIL